MKVEYQPKGITFTRLAIALAIAKGNDENAGKIAAKRWGEDSTVHQLLTKGGPGGLNNLLTKASVVGGSRLNWAQELVSAESARTEFFALVRDRSLIGRIDGLRRVPMDTRLVGEATGFSAAWVGEGQPVPVSSATYDEKDPLPPRKVSALTVITEELLNSADPSAELLIRDQLVGVCVEAIDLTFLDPANSGTANVKPASVTNGLTPLASSGNGLSDVRALIDDFPGDLQRAVIIGTAQTFAAMHDPIVLPTIGVRGGDVIGIPAIPSTHAGDDLIMIDPDGIALAEGPMALRTSREATIQMADNPTNNSTTPTAANMTSLWQCNAAAILAEKFINWQVARPSVSFVSGVSVS